MHSVLTKLDSLVENISQVKQGKKIPNRDESERWISIASTHHEQLKQTLLHDALNTTEEQALFLYIRNVQKALTTLLDKAYNLSKIVSDEDGMAERNASLQVDILIQQLKDGLEKILLFTKEYFAQYFDENQVIPNCFQDQYKKELSQETQQIKAQAKAVEIDYELLTIMLYPLEKFLNNNERISYKKRQYFKELIISLEIVINKKSIDTSKQVYVMLFHLNFNDALFFEHVIKTIKNETQSLTNKCEQLEKLNSLLKEDKQLQLRPGLALHTELPTIQYQIMSWIEEEIDYLKSAVSLNIQAVRQKEDNSKDGKINLSISVGVLGFLLKLLVAGQIITNSNQSEIIRFFSRHCKTSKREDISFESLYNKYHQANIGSVKITKELLSSLINLIPKIS